MDKAIQILELTPAIANEQTGLNAYVEKAEIVKKQEASIELVTAENYEEVKKLRAEITTWYTSIEKERLAYKRPLIDLGKAVDAKAKELANPFIDTKAKLQAKIDVYEKAERDRIEAENKRVQDLIEKFDTIETLEDLESYYKSLDVKDQRKKSVAEAGTLRKTAIQDSIRKKQRDEIVVKINKSEDVESLQNIELWEFKEDLGAMVSSKINKIKLEQLEAEKKERDLKDQKEKSDREKKEREERKEREAKEKKERDENNAKLAQAERVTLDVILEAIKWYNDAEAFDKYTKTVQDKIVTAENRDILAKAITEKAGILKTARDNEIKAEQEKRAQELKEKNKEKDAEIDKFVKKDRWEWEFKVMTYPDRIDIFKLVDTLKLTQK